MSRNIEAHLVKRAVEGNAEAFSEIYFCLRDSVYGFSFRMLNDTSAAEDITQEVFMFLIENPDKYSAERGQLLPFLCGVARNLIMRRLRNFGNGLEVATDFTENQMDLEDETKRSPLNTLLDQELAGKVEECISQLPPNQREVIILRELQDFSYQEIAEITETDVNTIKVWLHRARKTVARNLSPYLAEVKENAR